MKQWKRILAFLLVICMTIGYIPVNALADVLAEDPVVVIAGSDFQGKNNPSWNTSSGHTVGATNVKNILAQVQKDYTEVDGFLFAGDYDNDSTNKESETNLGIDTLMSAVQEKYSNINHDNTILVQGNHDYKVANLDATGNNDMNDYGVYVINEDDYMWYNDNESTIKTTASNLEKYLDEKVADKYDKPIFVVSHLPLHYSMRTYNDGDGRYANYIFDVLNEAGAEGLNIVFLFGHDHSHGWDDYLGGAAIYLEKGDKINIAQGSKTTYKEETLNFTYMNPGYVGYYGDTGNNIDKTLTMTVFEISDKEVSVKRYDANGLHNLKAEGIYGGEYPDKNYAKPVYSEDKAVKTSPKTIILKEETEEPDVPVVPEVPVEPVEMTDSDTGITVTAPGLKGLQIIKKNVNVPDGYSAYASYDIIPTGYTDGDEATVVIPVDSSFDKNRPVQVIDKTLNTSVEKKIVDGKVTFTTTHFSEYDIAQVAETIESDLEWTEIPGGSKTIFRLTNSLTNGKKYLIASSNVAGRTSIVNLNSTSINSINATVIADSNGNYIEAPVNSAQWTYTSNRLRNVGSTSRYLRGNNEGLSSTTYTSDYYVTYITWSVNNGKLRTQQYSSSGSYRYLRNTLQTTTGTGYASAYLYVEDTLTTSPTYAAIDGIDKYTIVTGEYADQTALEAMIESNIIVYTATNQNGANAAETSNYTLSGSVDPTRAGTYSLNVVYGGVTVGRITIDVVDKIVSDITVSPMEGSVERGSNTAVQTGSDIAFIYNDGTTGKVPVTVGMLSGNFDINKNGTYTGLTVTYQGKKVSGYTLHVTNVEGNDYPEYPNEGAVRVNKTGEGIDFQSSGLAKVELSTTGIPVNRGADVIIMVDTSSSMKESVDGTTRLAVMKNSLNNLMTQLGGNAEDGTPKDIRVAIADFNNYYNNSSSRYYLHTNDHLTGTTVRSGTSSPADTVYTGSKQLNSEAFVAASSVTSTMINSISTSSGTNYDYGLDAVYQLGEAIKAANEANEDETYKDRPLYVIFMSDGAPYQYNYFSSQSETGQNWNDWLMGTYASAEVIPAANNAHKYFYNGPGNKHRMAEAIKGDPDAMYTVIRKDSTDNYGGQDYMTQIPGLGATMYTVGFCLEDDKQVKVESMEFVLSNMATQPIDPSEKYYYSVDSANELNNAFTSIGQSIAYAATNAYFVDTMGDAYNLQLSTKTYTLPDGDSNTVAPEINVISYDIYTRADVGKTINGTKVTESMIGRRIGTSKTLETVTFNPEGTEAYSNKKTGNILLDGIINANTFWYNTTASAVMIDTDNNGTADYSLAPETFYWKVGTVNQTELAINYYVYLTGSMEGTREAGSYPTNKSATLYYTNWLGNDAHKDTVSPVHAWKGANVSYAFYLVNENGEIVVNQTTGETGSFTNRVAVTQPVVYKEVLLNSGEAVSAMEVATSDEGILPLGYTLYDTAAKYNVNVSSNSSGSWTIQKGNNLADSTYVTGFSGTEYSNEKNVNNAGYDYTHTTVWFAVKWEIKTIPDAVVIDYGLPVDISVLGNDMFGLNGTLSAVGSTKPAGTYTTNLDTENFKNSVRTSYGSASVNGSEVRYTLNTTNGMQMQDKENFVYAVKYEGTINPGYYYGDVTVIPATTIYYEDNFLTFNVYNNSDKSLKEDETWITVGTVNNNAVQDEDRPGEYSLPGIDANNVYGHDSAYEKMSQYSLGSAKMINVNADKFATAEFTFYGTGFDVVGLTSNKTGTISIDVKNAATGKVKTYLVDTYYGYKFVDGEWVVDTTDSDNALYQIPVMQVEGLDYGQYEVTITAAYAKMFDHKQYDNKSYDLYLDAIRIYDPSGVAAGTENKVISDAYKEDGEAWPEYYEVRNQIIEAGKFETLGGDDIGTGVIFIDGKDGSTEGLIPTIADYANFGPNNEVYLNKGQAVAFKLNLNNIYTEDTVADIADVQIGLKSVGGTAKVKVYDSVTSKAANTPIQEIATATDMYYSIKELKDGVIVVYNAGTDADAMLSVTNIKITFKTEPVKKEAVEETASVFTMNRMMSGFALRSMMPEEVKEPEPFVPEIFEVMVDKDTVTVDEDVTVSVKGSEEVAFVTINGNIITDYVTNEAGTRIWTQILSVTEIGEFKVEVAAYNAENVGSGVLEHTVTVMEKTVEEVPETPEKPAGSTIVGTIVNSVVKTAVKVVNAILNIFKWF